MELCNELNEKIASQIDGNVAETAPSETSTLSETSAASEVGRLRGRPKRVISKERLQELLYLDFNVSDIASHELLGYPIHRNTIHKFMKDEGMSSRDV